MDVQHPDAEIRRGLAGTGNGVGNVVKLEVQEHPEAEPHEAPDHIGAGHQQHQLLIHAGIEYFPRAAGKFLLHHPAHQQSGATDFVKHGIAAVDVVQTVLKPLTPVVDAT